MFKKWFNILKQKWKQFQHHNQVRNLAWWEDAHTPDPPTLTDTKEEGVQFRNEASSHAKHENVPPPQAAQAAFLNSNEGIVF